MRALFCFILFFSNCYADDIINKKLKVGAILPFSGELAYFGKAFERGASLAFDDGVGKYISIKYEDDKSADRKTAASALHSLLSKEKIQSLIVTGMPTAVALDSIVKKNDIVSFSAWDSNKELNKLSSNTYGFGWSNEKTGESLAEYAVTKLGIKSFAIIQAQDEWSLLISKAFKEKVLSLGGKIVFNDTVKLDDTDFLSLITKLKKSNPDGIYLPLYKASLVAITKQIIQLKYEGTLLTAEGMTEAELKQIGYNPNKMYVTQAKLTNSNFKKKYHKKFGKNDNLNLAHVAVGYDMIHYLNSCIELLRDKKLSITSKNLKTIFKVNIFNGLLGVSSFKDKKSTERGQTILIAKNGKLVTK